MKEDIMSREDIDYIVKVFYEKIKNDKELSLFFTKVVPVDWTKHISLMCSFWENILFYTGDYEGNPLIAHKKFNEKKETSFTHFKRWLDLFEDSVNEKYEGPNAQKMKNHAHAISMVMLKKL